MSEQSERTLDRSISTAVEMFRLIFGVLATISVLTFVVQGEPLIAFFLGLGLVPLYYLGLYFVALWIALIAPASELSSLVQAQRLRLINEKLDTGELKPDTPELHAAMLEAGLRVPPKVLERGPVLGHQFGNEFYEYVIAQDPGSEVQDRYEFVSIVTYDEDGTIALPNQTSKFLAIDDFLYECPNLEEVMKGS